MTVATMPSLRRGDLERCARTYARHRLRTVRPARALQRRPALAQHGDAKLTDLLHTLADCPKARSVSDRCKGVHEGL